MADESYETLNKIGLVTSAEIESGKAVGGTIPGRHVVSAAEVAAMIVPPPESKTPTTAAPRFHVEQRVRARNINPMGHTRLPRYLRGKLGTIERCGELSRCRTGTLKVVVSTTSHSLCIRCASPRGNCGVDRQTRAIPCTSICGKLILNPLKPVLPPIPLRPCRACRAMRAGRYLPSRGRLKLLRSP